MSAVWRSATTALVLAMAAALPAGAAASTGEAGQGTQDGAGTITGQVMDAGTGALLDAVTVHIPGTDFGTLTGADGRFTLEGVPAGTHTIRAERIGYSVMEEEVTVAEGETVNVDLLLAPEALALDEVVATGVVGGTQRRAIGNVVDRIDAAQIQEVTPTANVDQLLANRVPGLTALPGAGIPGSDATRIRLRGSSSTALPNDPIIYVDGIRINNDIRFAGATGAQSRLNDINPADIESIEVIKGPAAATLYGTEASAGVIQILTKRGAEGAPSFDARVELGGNFLRNPERRFNDNWAVSPVTGEIISHNLVADREAEGRPIFETGLHQSYNLSAQGGTETLRYFGSFTWSDREGAQPDIQWDKRTAARVAVTFLARENLELETGASWTKGETRFGTSSGAIVWGTPGTRADAGGAEDPRDGFFSTTPESLRDLQAQVTDVERYAFNVSANWEPLSWLRGRAVLGQDFTREDRSTFTVRAPDQPFFGVAGNEGRKVIEGRETRVTTFDANASVSFRFMDDRLGSQSSSGFQFFNRQTWDQFARGDNFATAALSTVGAAAETFGGEDFLENTTVGTFVQQQFDWEERIFLTGAVRFDDNSAFGADFDAAVYPKVSATWVVSEEAFWDVPQVNSLRLRGAWGEAGRQPDVLDAARLFTAVTGPGDQPTIAPLAFGSPDLGPEEGSELEIGLDASFLNDRLQLEFTRWWKTTTDAIVETPLGPSIGFAGAQLVNIGEVRNWGFESQLDIAALNYEPVRWDVGIGFARMKNRVEDLGPGLESIPVRRGRQHRVGFPLASIFEYEIVSADFVEGDSGPVTNLMCDAGTGPGNLHRGGEIVPCEEANRLFLGHSEPTWILNLSSTVTLFDNLRIFANLDARAGHAQIQDAFNARQTSFSNTEFAVRENDPIVQAYRQLRRDRLGFHKGGFARLREIAVNYTLPARWAQSFGADRASLNVAARNIATPWRQQEFTDIGPQRIADPEMNMPSEGFPGEATTVMPPLSSVMVTLNVNF